MTLLQRLADPILLAILVGMGVYGFQCGVFLATLSAMQLLASALGALAMVDELSAIAMLAGCPEPWCGAVGYTIGFAAVFVATRLAIGAAVPEGAVRFPPAMDSAAGAVVGMLAGVLLGGAILVACSMTPLGPGGRLDPARLGLNLGPKILDAFVRIATADPDAQASLLRGDAARPYVPPPPEEESSSSLDQPPPLDGAPPLDRAPPLVGEPFADDDGDGEHDPEEPFLDIDGDGGYTAAMTFVDRNHNGRRDVGLVERYALGGGRWDRIVVVAPPQIESQADPPTDPAPASDSEPAIEGSPAP